MTTGKEVAETLHKCVISKDKAKARDIGEQLYKSNGLQFMKDLFWGYCTAFCDVDQDGDPHLLNSWWMGIGDWTKATGDHEINECKKKYGHCGKA